MFISAIFIQQRNHPHPSATCWKHSLLIVLFSINIWNAGYIENVDSFKTKKIIYGIAVAHLLGLLKEPSKTHAHPVPIMLPPPKKCKKEMHIHEHLNMMSDKYGDDDFGMYGKPYESGELGDGLDGGYDDGGFDTGGFDEGGYEGVGGGGDSMMYDDAGTLSGAGNKIRLGGRSKKLGLSSSAKYLNEEEMELDEAEEGMNQDVPPAADDMEYEEMDPDATDGPDGFNQGNNGKRVINKYLHKLKPNKKSNKFRKPAKRPKTRTKRPEKIKYADEEDYDEDGNDDGPEDGHEAESNGPSFQPNKFKPNRSPPRHMRPSSSGPDTINYGNSIQDKKRLLTQSEPDNFQFEGAYDNRQPTFSSVSGKKQNKKKKKSNKKHSKKLKKSDSKIVKSKVKSPKSVNEEFKPGPNMENNGSMPSIGTEEEKVKLSKPKTTATLGLEENLTQNQLDQWYQSNESNILQQQLNKKKNVLQNYLEKIRLINPNSSKFGLFSKLNIFKSPLLDLPPTYSGFTQDGASSSKNTTSNKNVSTHTSGESAPQQATPPDLTQLVPIELIPVDHQHSNPILDSQPHEVVSHEVPPPPPPQFETFLVPSSAIGGSTNGGGGSHHFQQSSSQYSQSQHPSYHYNYQQEPNSVRGQYDQHHSQQQHQTNPTMFMVQSQQQDPYRQQQSQHLIPVMEQVVDPDTLHIFEQHLSGSGPGPDPGTYPQYPYFKRRSDN